MVELTALSSKIGRSFAAFLNLYVSHGSAAKFSRNGDKYYISFVDNPFLF